eukprot:TRINITY_DN65904_c0_g1_i1.p1 TRINITY_DN65904_c0_g1~~TRINITY_DN65904_c0_g1_i1.p1  ORF type:complete len:707 (+),score=102.56 TRINITY_DN65904_c0_g1_i1:43-2121(+)
MGFMSSISGMLCDGVPLPKSLYVQNKRLGFLFRVLQLAALGIAVSQLVLGRAWLTIYVPAGTGFSMWFTAGDKSDLQDSNVRHCADPSFFEYKWSNSFIYRPTGCGNVDSHRTFSKETSLSAYYMTYAQDTMWWNADGKDCGAHASAECQRQGKVYSENGASCSCKGYRDYFVKNAEMNMLSFIHGYKVPTSPDRKDFQLGVSGDSSKEETDMASGSSYTKPGSIRTRFYDSKGNRCDMAGTSEWSTEDARGGIDVRLVDILKCDHADLDVKRPELRSWVDGESGLPTMRLAGAMITLEFSYENQAVHQEGFQDELCKVIVTADPTWNSRTAFTPMQVQNPSANHTEYYTTYNYGISIMLKPTGSMAFLDIPALINSLTSVVVLLGLPSSIIACLAFNVVGKYSKIYKKSAVERLSIGKRLAGIVARQFSAMASYRSITSQQKVPYDELQDMPSYQVMELAEDVFRGIEDKSPDGGSKAEMLGRFLSQKMDISNSGGISLSDFMTVATQNEVMTTEEIGQLAGSSGSSILERIFSDHGKIFKVRDDSIVQPPDVKPVLARQASMEVADLAEQQEKLTQSLEELRLIVESSKQGRPGPDCTEENLQQQGPAPQASSAVASSIRLSSEPIEGKTPHEMIRCEMLEMQELGLKTIMNRTESAQMSHQATMNRRLRSMEEQIAGIHAMLKHQRSEG